MPLFLTLWLLRIVEELADVADVLEITEEPEEVLLVQLELLAVEQLVLLLAEGVLCFLLLLILWPRYAECLGRLELLRLV